MTYLKLLAIAFLLVSNLGLTHDSFAVYEETIDITGNDRQCVILLHGLARTSKSMQKMEARLGKTYHVQNVSYPSTKYEIAHLSENYIPPAVEQCNDLKSTKIHFVTHSMGGILLRTYLDKHNITNIGHVVMLSPPNHGSEVVDKLKNVPGYTLLNGPAGHQLGTDSGSIPLNIGPANFDLGIITGDRSINLFLSMLISGEDDGKVSTESAKLAGMSDFLVVHHSHPFIMQHDDVIGQTLYFLKNGFFKSD